MADTETGGQDFYENIVTAKGVQAKFEVLHDYAQNIGFQDIFYANLKVADATAPLSQENITVLRAGDEQWNELYEQEGYGKLDWAVEHAVWSQRPYRLSIPPTNLTDRQEKFVKHAHENKRQNGFCMPFRGPFGLTGGFSANGADSVPSDATIAKMLSAALLFDVMARTEQTDALAEKYKLTAREIEFMRLLVNGRSMMQIAHLVGVTDQWVRLTFMNMRKKFRVSSNSALVYRLTALRII